MLGVIPGDEIPGDEFPGEVERAEIGRQKEAPEDDDAGLVLAGGLDLTEPLPLLGGGLEGGVVEVTVGHPSTSTNDSKIER